MPYYHQSNLRILVDTSVWLDIATRRDGQKWIVPIRFLKHQGLLEIITPSLILDEFDRNRPRAEREQLIRRRGIRDPTDLYAMLREFGSSIAGAVTIADPETASQTAPSYEPISEREIIQRLRRAALNGDLGSDDQSRSMLAGYQPKLLLARFDNQWYVPHGRAQYYSQ